MGLLGPVRVGGGAPVRVMGVLNASPESFYGGSVRTTPRGMRAAAAAMERAGADIIDVGGMSTAPYLKAAVPERVEARRAAAAARAAVSATSLPVSVDTCRAGPARAALAEGACIVNDVTGLSHDPAMAGVLREASPSVVLCARGPGGGGGPAHTARLLREAAARAARAGVPRGRIAVDPALGFFRGSGRGRLFTRIRGDWASRDVGALLRAGEAGGGLPVVVSVSRKSFLSRLAGPGGPGGRLAASLACEAAAVLGGASVIRTHDVAESRAAARAARAAMRRRARPD